MLRSVFVVSGSTRERFENLEFNTWGELETILNEEGVETQGLRAQLIKTKVTLEHPDATIPGEEGETISLVLSQKKIKAGNGQIDPEEIQFDISEVEQMDGNQRGAVLKQLKKVATLTDDEEVLDAIGNWTNISKDERLARYEKVMNIVESRSVTEEEEETVVAAGVSRDDVEALVHEKMAALAEQFNDRLCKLEFPQGIVTEGNERQFNIYWTELAEKLTAKNPK